MERVIDNIVSFLENVKYAWQDMFMKKQRKKKLAGRRRSLRFAHIKWRLAGIGLIAGTLPVVKILEGDATIALLTVPLGIYMASGKTIRGKYE